MQRGAATAEEGLGPSRHVAIISIMTATTLVGEYALVLIPNVELGTTVLFFTGLVFGAQVAVPCAILSSIVFASINPWGVFIPQVWLAQLIGWLYVVTAAHLARTPDREIGWRGLAILGAAVTIEFDLVTNIGYSLAFSVPYWVAVLAGLPFMIIHVVSNAWLFALAIPRLERALLPALNSQIAPEARMSSEE